MSRPVVDLVAGARPNFVKLAPLAAALRAQDRLAFRIVHTGQHYDRGMDDVFFQELDIPRPDVHLNVGSGSHGAQTARILERYEQQIVSDRPAATIVFGDVNSTIACALAASKLQVPVAHVEAGLRSFDRTMPEEINRVLTDAIADLLLTSEPSGAENLRREGIDPGRIRFVGNIMVDTLLANLPRARCMDTRRRLGLEGRPYGLITLHRPSNVDDPGVLTRLIDLFEELAADVPLVFPVHPRTKAAAVKAGVEQRLTESRQLIAIEPLSYIQNMSLLAGAVVVLTDSGGLQEETAVLGIPCLTLRPNTERPVTTVLGTSRLVGNDACAIRDAFADAVAGRWSEARAIPLWDGHAADRIATEVATWVGDMM